MKAIAQNPYRMLGLLVGATAREQDRQIRRLKQYVEAGQKPENDFSFPAIGKFQRTLDDIDEASSKLNSDADKMSAALFWFYNGNEITDEPAFEALKKGDVATAKSIWGNLIIGTKDGKRFWKEVSKRNRSAFHNWFVLEFFNKPVSSLTSNIKFLGSDYCTELKEKATDNTYRITNRELQLLFLNGILQEIESGTVNLSLSNFIKSVNNENFIAKQDFYKNISKKLTARISAAIETAGKKRKADGSDAANAGETLYLQVKDDLAQLKSISEDFTCSNISDKVADEILQCGSDYFERYKDTDTDPSAAFTELIAKAKTLASGEFTEKRCKEKTEILQTWINNAPEREKQRRIAVHYTNLMDAIQLSYSKPKNISTANYLVTQAKPTLAAIKYILGNKDDLYLKLSTQVALQANNCVIEEVNKAQENFQYNMIIDRNGTLLRVRNTMEQAWKVTQLIGALDMDPDFIRKTFNPNKETLKNICSQVGVSTYSASFSSSSSTKSSGACYIATMAYGDYDHPQVILLRQFRDNTLEKSAFGKWFIKNYYYYSPQLVEKLKEKKTVNIIIRKILNQFIKVIK